MRVVPFTPEHAQRWDELVDEAPMGTFLHTRRFLSYHGDRFSEASVLLVDGGGNVVAVLPAALDPDDPRRVVSHPGITYGGLVHAGGLNGDRTRDALRAVCAHYADGGAEVLRYKPVPHIYHRSPSADDVWALSDLGACRVRCDLSCAIDMRARRAPTSRRARSLAKARRTGVSVANGDGVLEALWPVVEWTFDRRHSATPTHSLEEIELLRSRFPDEIDCAAGVVDGEVVAGTVLFKTETVVHAQYLAANEKGMRGSALDAVIEWALELARDSNARYFDFGISPGPVRGGLQPGVYRYKAEFGGGGVVYEHYEQPLGIAR